MSDLATDQKAKLLALKQEREAKQASTTVENKPPVVENEPATAINTSVAPTTTGEAVPPVSEVPVPATIDKSEESSTTSQTSTPSESNEIEFKWDEGLTESTPVTQNTQVDFKKIGSALSLEISSEDDLVKVVGEKLSKLKQTEELSSALASIPDNLKETIEIAKKGGDWQTFIENSIVDPTKFDPINLFEREYERANVHRFRQPDGTIDYTKLDDELDSIPDGVKSMQGNVIKQQLISQQNQRQQAIQAESMREQDKFRKDLLDAAKELPQYFPKEEWGVIVEPKHALSVTEGIANGTLVKKHLGDIDQKVISKLDAKKLTRLIFLAETGKNIAEHRFKQGIVNGKKQLLDNVQNTQITRPSTTAAPETPDDQKPLTAVDKLKKVFQRNSNDL